MDQDKSSDMISFVTLN